MNIMLGYITWAYSNCSIKAIHTLNPQPHIHTHTHSLFLPSSLTSSQFCLNLPPSPLCSLLLSSPPHLLVLLYLSPSSTTLFSVRLPIPISFPTSQWLRNWQSVWCLDSWSSVPAIWICLAFTFTTTSVHTCSFRSSLGDPIPSTLLVYSTLEGSFSSHLILVDMFSSRTPVKAQKSGRLLGLALEIGFLVCKLRQSSSPGVVLN